MAGDGTSEDDDQKQVCPHMFRGRWDGKEEDCNTNTKHACYFLHFTRGNECQLGDHDNDPPDAPVAAAVSPANLGRGFDGSVIRRKLLDHN